MSGGSMLAMKRSVVGFGLLFATEIRKRTTAIRPYSPNTTSSCASQLAVTRSVISRIVMLGTSRTSANFPRTLIHNSPKTTPEP